MSSTLRTVAQPTKLATKFNNISTPSYSDSTLGELVPIPFSYNNGVIDILITNSDVQNLIDNGTSPNDDTEYQAKMLGGKRLATSIGSNFDTYLRNLINSLDTLGAPYAGELQIVVNPVMTKAQLAQPSNVTGLTFENVFGVNDTPPSSDEYVGGNATNVFYTFWAFYSPLTVRYTSSASTTGFRYITFSTHHDGD